MGARAKSGAGAVMRVNLDPPANSLLYTHWPDWRLAEEIAAYRVQALCYPVEQQPATKPRRRVYFQLFTSALKGGA